MNFKIDDIAYTTEEFIAKVKALTESDPPLIVSLDPCPETSAQAREIIEVLLVTSSQPLEIFRTTYHPNRTISISKQPW